MADCWVADVRFPNHLCWGPPNGCFRLVLLSIDVFCRLKTFIGCFTSVIFSRNKCYILWIAKFLHFLCDILAFINVYSSMFAFLWCVIFFCFWRICSDFCCFLISLRIFNFSTAHFLNHFKGFISCFTSSFRSFGLVSNHLVS